ncbi:hypothetical protein [Campylobacter concisus]|uniref:Lipoprotein n=1 Tax=Campylobacter concisus TaxID=199 RepID=A0A1X0U308_9BACT|nr:hypothetical protein A3835_02310 [Campylobacter concisus]
MIRNLALVLLAMFLLSGCATTALNKSKKIQRTDKVIKSQKDSNSGIYYHISYGPEFDFAGNGRNKTFYYYLEIFPVKTDFINPYIKRNDEYVALTECYSKLLNVSSKTGVIHVSTKEYILPSNPNSIMLYRTLESKKRIELSDFSVCDSSVKWKRLQEAPKESNK